MVSPLGSLALIVTEINFNHFVIVLDKIDSTFCQDLAHMHHSNHRSELAHEKHVMFDNENRTIPLQTLQQFTSAVTFCARHASHRFIKQEKFWLLCEEHPAFEPLFL